MGLLHQLLWNHLRCVEMADVIIQCSSFMESYGHYLIGELLYMALWGISCSQL